MTDPKQIIENIRKIRFGIGLDTEELPEEIKGALEDKYRFQKDASRLAKEIHTKNPHSIFELIQNAEDNEYGRGITPKIRFIIDLDRLIIQNNEKGFEEKNVCALCGIGRTTKTKALGYIGEKGIGFKSVFMIANKVHIYSNGFQFEFNYDESNPVSMIIPEWIDDIPNFVDPKQTNIVLHLKPEVKNELSSYIEEIHPSLLLFLRKLKVIEIEDKNRNRARRMELYEKDEAVEIVYGENKSHWKVIRKSLRVQQGINEKRRKDVNETEIILAFPLNKNGSPDTSNEQYVFAFLPVRKYGFKFIIQTDFILPITREDIIKDNKWNEWLRNSIVEVFLDAVSEFKKDEKLKYSFYDYLPLEEVKEEFFLPLVEQIYERLKEEECILTEANRWRRPSEVLIGDEEIKKIVSNDDLQKFFGKEYLSERIKSKKSILRKLGVRDFSIDDLIKCLEKSEWVKKQDEKWFANIFRYLSKKKLSDEQLERLNNLDIIKLENGELTSINQSVVFFPLEKKVVYGFENELRVIKKEVIDVISKYEKEEMDNILEFLKKLGLKQADSYEIIENHILPVYENDVWKQKDSTTLVGHVRYIKDNIERYEKESDERLNAKRSYYREDPLEHLKKLLLIRINKDDYANPENVYLPRIYGNENNLEELFKGIDVSFVHPCYIEQDIKYINSEIAELENELNSKSKKWKKKHKKEVKKIEKMVKELKKEKEKNILEWKEFFLKIGVWETLMVKKDPDTEIFEGPAFADNRVTRKEIYKWNKKETIWKDEDWWDTDWKYYIGNDWISNDFQKVVEKIQKPSTEILCGLLDKYWNNIYERYRKSDYYYRYYGQRGWNCSSTKSTFLLTLQNLRWIPTTEGLHKPYEVFLDSKENRELLGETVPYLAVEIKNEDFIKILGINTQANVEGVLNYLKALVEQKNNDKEKFEKLYKFLDEHFEEDSIKIKEEFSKSSLIFVPDTEKEYYSNKEVIWDDVSNIFGKVRVYLEKYYPSLKRFFVEKLGISEKPTPKDYANVLLSMSEKSEISDEDKKIIVKIYEELNRNLSPDKVGNPISQEDWWGEFIEKSIFLTDRGEFRCRGNIFINDDNEIYELFKYEEDIGFLWLPEGYHLNKIKFFIKACGLSYISKNTKAELSLESDRYSKDEELTKSVQTRVPYVLRYLYWKENQAYEELKKEEILKKIGAIGVYATENLKVEYSVNVNEWKKIYRVTGRNCIHYDGNLYILKDNTNINHLALEFSKLFGKIKGLDSFLLLIMKIDTSEIEQIMRIQNISELPETEMNILKKVPEILKTKQKEKKEEEKLEETSFKKEETEESSTLTKTTPQPLLGSAGYAAETGEDISDKTIEKNWTPEVSPEKAHINVEEYIPEKERKSSDKKSSIDKSPATYGGNTTPTEVLSKKAKEAIGYWGEKYAFICIKNKLMEKYPGTSLVDTEQGFRLEKDGSAIVEVVWLNKKEESGEHYDIKIVENGEELFIEVKSTKEYGKAWFQVSKDQWRLMKEKGDKFYIYRVYGAGTKEAKVEKIPSPERLWLEGHINAYPIGIEV